MSRKMFLMLSAIEKYNEKGPDMFYGILHKDSRANVNGRLASLEGLESRPCGIHGNLLGVVAGVLLVNRQITYLQNELDLLRDLSGPVRMRDFTSSTNRRLLVVNMSTLLRAAIALNDTTKLTLSSLVGFVRCVLPLPSQLSYGPPRPRPFIYDRLEIGLALPGL